jgi:DNA-binding GntR family transcriptional regulator
MSSSETSGSNADLYDRFIADVLAGLINPAQRIGEISLSQRWGVGQTPVRETLYRLEQDGIIQRKLRSGTFLRDIQLDEILEILDVRIVHEALAAAHAAQHATPDELQQLAHLATKADSYQLAIPDRVLADQSFHLRLCEVSHLRHVPRIFRLLRTHIYCARLIQGLVHAQDSRALPVIQPDHRQIVQVLRTGDPQAAAAIVRAHLEEAKQQFIRGFSPSSSSSSDAHHPQH